MFSRLYKRYRAWQQKRLEEWNAQAETSSIKVMLWHIRALLIIIMIFLFWISSDISKLVTVLCKYSHH